MAFLSCPKQGETFSRPRARYCVLDSLSCFIIPTSLPTSWQHCVLMTADTRVGVFVFYSVPSHCWVCAHPPSHFFWVDRSAGSQPCLSPSPSCHYSDFKCATTIISLHQKPCISSFLRCQAFLPFDVNDYWTYIKKIPPLIIFPVCLFQRVTCGSSAWQGRLHSWQ